MRRVEERCVLEMTLKIAGSIPFCSPIALPECRLERRSESVGFGGGMDVSTHERT